MAVQMASPAVFRGQVGLRDRAVVEQIVLATDLFTDEEVSLAVATVDERLRMGSQSRYEFLFAERDGVAVGFTCFGRVPCSAYSWDLYWIAVHPDCQGIGLGRQLLSATEDAVRLLGGTRLYVDTSSHVDYRPTRAFYSACGYTEAANLPDFYGPDDGKVVYFKPLSACTAAVSA
jgi:GNAT superfamily N-acetyltransferase